MRGRWVRCLASKNEERAGPGDTRAHPSGSERHRRPRGPTVGVDVIDLDQRDPRFVSVLTVRSAAEHVELAAAVRRRRRVVDADKPC